MFTIYELEVKSYNEIFETVAGTHAYYYSDFKTEEVFKKVWDSEKIGKMIFISRTTGMAPYAQLFTRTVEEMFNLFFTKSLTICLASLCALQRWNDEANQQNALLSSSELKALALEIVKESNPKFPVK